MVLVLSLVACLVTTLPLAMLIGHCTLGGE
jgi:hypothetical protein